MDTNRNAAVAQSQETQQAQEPAETQRRHLMDEADIGSGEKTPGEKETEEEIRKIPPLPPQDAPAKP